MNECSLGIQNTTSRIAQTGTKTFFGLMFLSGLLLVNCTSFNCVGQPAGLDSLHKKFDQYRTSLPQEKLYVHTDQELYLTGETIWFKIYYVDGVKNQPSDISKVAYLEILDKDNHPVLQTKVALKNGEGHGSFYLPSSIDAGNYNLRAYTQWMRNNSPDYFFHKSISIINTFRKLEPETITPSKPFHVQFFPEGGNLVYDLRSKVAFQATDVHGKGINLKGVLLDDQNDTLARFTPQKFGIGNFMFTPRMGHEYRAVLTDTIGNTQTFKVPQPLTSGYVMQVVDSTETQLAIHISAKNADVHSAALIHYFIHARQIVSSSGTRTVANGKNTILIPKQSLSEGISHITIFDDTMRPQCERLYFKTSDKTLTISVRPSQGEYGVRRKVILDISTTAASTAEPTSMSLAVVKTDSLQSEHRGNIFPYLWLTSELKGTVENPMYYFTNGNDEVRSALDNLMLTHGWRRFNWDEILSGKNITPSFIPEYRGHLIRGSVAAADGSPLRGVATFLSTPGKNIQLYTARSNQRGDVQFEMKDFFGPKRIIVQNNTAIDSTLQIKIHSPYADVYALNNIYPLNLQSMLSNLLLERSVAMQVQDIYHEERTRKFDITEIDSTSFYGKADETYLLDDFTRFPVMEEVLREYVPGVMVRKRRDGFHFIVLNSVRKGVFSDDPLVLVDGMPVFDIDKVMAFDPLKVKKLEVLTRGYYLGPIPFSGVLSYKTYQGDLGGFAPDAKAVSMDYEGLQRMRIFYSPQYENEKQRDSRLPDRRNVLFWTPHVHLTNGKAQVEFYTSDLTGKYTIVVEGLTKSGYAGSGTSSFSVKEFNN